MFFKVGLIPSNTLLLYIFELGQIAFQKSEQVEYQNLIGDT